VRFDLEAEMKVIGAAMSDARIIPGCNITGEDFHRPAHEELWNLIVTEERAGRPTDPVSIGQRLLANPINGLPNTYLAECYGSVSSAGSGTYFAGIVAGLARLRRMAALGEQLAQLAGSTAWDESAEAIENARAILDKESATVSTAQVRTFADALKDAVERWDSPDTRTRYRTGWADLDSLLNGGWMGGQLTIVGARPAVGKSVVAGCAAVAAEEYGCGYFSLEMDEYDTVNRMSAAAQGIDLWRIQNHKLTEQDWTQRVSKLVQRSLSMNIFLDNRERLSMAQVRAQVRTWKRKKDIKLVIIDYLQILRPADTKNDSRERQVNRLAEDCKLLAREFDIHVLVLAQVGRGSTQREDKRPTMSDLRESGGIEAHADNIILLHRDDKEKPGDIEFNVEKNRHGRTGQLVLDWAPHVSSVRDPVRV
jgi:replicative DNA helicase